MYATFLFDIFLSMVWTDNETVVIRISVRSSGNIPLKFSVGERGNNYIDSINKVFSQKVFFFFDFKVYTIVMCVDNNYDIPL